MGYLSIPNLYKDTRILSFKEVYASEKIHGSSAHIKWDGKSIRAHSGGVQHSTFEALFDILALTEKFIEIFGEIPVTVYGEAYGGKMQRMKNTYGKDLKFIAFEVKVDQAWLNVPNAHDIATKLGLEFVHYVKVSTDIKDLDRERDADSVQAIRNGMGKQKREGVVLRPLEEYKDYRGNRVICKHKGESFSEVKTPRVIDPEQLKVLEDAKEIAEEWATLNRLKNILSKLPEDTNIEATGTIIKAMWEDIEKEGQGEFISSSAVRKAISKNAATLFRDYLRAKLY